MLQSKDSIIEGKQKDTEITRPEHEAIAPYERDFERILDRFERDFEDFWAVTPHLRGLMRESPMPTRMTVPSVDLEDRGSDYRITADLPGFKKGDIIIEITDNAVTIQGKKSGFSDEANRNYIHRERTMQSFYRRLLLPERTNSEQAKAALNNGTLEIILPKKEPKSVKKLQVS